MSRMIFFDPGVTTGAILLCDETYTPTHLGDNLSEIYSYLDDWYPDVVAYEEFRKRPNAAAAELYSLQVIGVIRLWCEIHNVPTWHKPPADTKPFWTDDKIKKLGLWTSGMKHAMDALRLALAYRNATDAVWAKETMRKLR